MRKLLIYFTSEITLKHFCRISYNIYFVNHHISSTSNNIKWDHFEILTTGKSDIHCRIKETLLIRDLKPALNENVGSWRLQIESRVFHIRGRKRGS